MLKNNIPKGFTLIEILVVLAIIVIITSVVIFNIGSERQNSALLRSVQKLSLDLRRAQSFALSSKVFKTIGIPCGWGVHFNGMGSDNYVIFADLALNPNCSDRDFIRAADGSEDFETIYLESGITVNSLSSGLSDIVFTPPEPTVTFTPAQTSSSITLININSVTRAININKTGFISSP
ncbi:MAG: prepilin-type N-terminal cleavage/methylation domain-containing protein [Parcubacteria group bacterium]|nr:prepilin-type N-terminal cleavage/methylation domain-containing protein [Parcubacteria group bacterium]